MKEIRYFKSTRGSLFAFVFFASAALLAGDIQYSVLWKGVPNSSILKSLKQASNLENFKKKKPKSVASLQYRATEDIPALQEVLRAYGYYDGCITTSLMKKTRGYEVIVKVESGPQYRFKAFHIEEEEGLPPPSLATLGIELGAPATTFSIAESEKSLISLLQNQGYPLAQIEGQKIVVDSMRKGVFVDLQVDPGPLAHFGKVTIGGNESVDSSFIQHRIEWKEGDLFSTEAVERTQKALFDTGLFSTVVITHAPYVDSEGSISMMIWVTESRHQSLLVGGSYHTTWEGFGGMAEFQADNLFGKGIGVKANYVVTQKKQVIGLGFSVPDFLAEDQTLSLDSKVTTRDHQPSYFKQSVETTLAVERVFNRYMTASLGAQFNQVKTTNSTDNQFFSLFGIPGNFSLRSSDKVLVNPQLGGWFKLDLAPYFSLRTSPNPNWMNVQASGAFYFPLGFIKFLDLVAAQSVVFGSIFGAQNSQIPPPYRFYAGSPNYLRGYPYQSIGPLDSNNVNIGGRSIFLYSVEGRLMIFKDLQAIGFYDVGNVYSRSFPNLSTSMAQSAGVGACYYTFVGPIRLNIAFPIVKVKNVTATYQIFVNIGQPF